MTGPAIKRLLIPDSDTRRLASDETIVRANGVDLGAGTPDWSDWDAVIDHVVGLLRAFAGDSPHFDEAATRDLVGRDVDRTVNIASSLTNHFVIDTGDPIRDRLGTIGTPTLVIHGAKDPVFPLDHGLALSKEIPDARLLTLGQTGHELPPAVWNVVIPAVIQRTSDGRDNLARGYYVPGRKTCRG